MMTGYSGKPLVVKLGIKASCRLQLRGAPPGFTAELQPLPDEVRFVGAQAKQADCVILFATRILELSGAFRKAAAVLPPAGQLWVAWPKRAANVPTDLSENEVRRIGLAAGLVDIKVCAITEIWSGLKFVRRLKDR
jgi:hypothetical protein